MTMEEQLAQAGAALVIILAVLATLATMYVYLAWWTSHRVSRFFRWAVALDVLIVVAAGGLALVAAFALTRNRFPFAGFLVALLVSVLLLGPIGHAAALWLTARHQRQSREQKAEEDDGPG